MASLWVIINMHKNARENEDKELFALLTSHGFVKTAKSKLELKGWWWSSLNPSETCKFLLFKVCLTIIGNMVPGDWIMRIIREHVPHAFTSLEYVIRTVTHPPTL